MFADIDDALSTPRAATRDALARCPGDVIVLGAGGKMGPTLTRMVARAAAGADSGGARRVFAVSRWSNAESRAAMESWGIETISADLLDRGDVERLPDAPNVIFMAGQKFGTTGAPDATWAMNTIVPAHCAERYRGSRIVAFSTGNVYPLTSVVDGGSRETDPVGPVGEYAQSCVGRERVFEHFARRAGTRVAIVRLNYAIDVRYGVLLDIATRVYKGTPVPLDMGYVNVIWQGDANRIAIECLPHAASPPFVVNVTGTDTIAVRGIAEQFARQWDKDVTYAGVERPDALLSNTERMEATFSPPDTPIDEMMYAVSQWVEHGGRVLGKPTHFEARDGAF
jgi:nucleoside-diphosphate-sugar epimerase